jgi:tyrosyl-tRNA synthetase
MYQFWLNTDDADVIDRLKVFTFLTRKEIEQYSVLVKEEPQTRAAQRRLALEVTELVHSKEDALAAEAASLALFGTGDLAQLPEKSLRAALQELPNAELSKGTTVVQALVATGLVDSNGAAKRAIQQGSVSVNKVKVELEDAEVDFALAGQMAVLARGKKNLAGLFLAR